MAARSIKRRRHGTCEQEWRAQPLAGAMLLPNLAALARGDAAATGGPASQGSVLPPASQAPRPNDEAGAPKPPHEVHSIEGVVRAVLAQIGGADDPEAACATVESFCDTDKFHDWACYAGDPTDPQNPWRVITERVFKSTDDDKALFAHDELLKTDPKKAFKAACKDRQIARAAGLNWLSDGLQRAHRHMFYNWEGIWEDQFAEISANQIMSNFYDQVDPLLCKAREWSLVARDEYNWGIRPGIKAECEGRVKVADWIGEAALGLRYNASTYSMFTNTSLWNILSGYDVSSYPRSSMENGPMLAARFAHTERRVRALAARVGRAMVFAFHKNAQSASDPGGADALTYVASEPRVLP